MFVGGAVHDVTIPLGDDPDAKPQSRPVRNGPEWFRPGQSDANPQLLVDLANQRLGRRLRVFDVTAGNIPHVCEPLSLRMSMTKKHPRVANEHCCDNVVLDRVHAPTMARDTRTLRAAKCATSRLAPSPIDSEVTGEPHRGDDHALAGVELATGQFASVSMD